MSLNGSNAAFDATFGASKKNTSTKTEDRPAANYWLNIGYPVEVQNEEGVTETRFVSLPVGIPLDNQKLLPTNSRNEGFAQFQSARNDLHAQLMALAEGLAAGEEKMINLQIQLRRVNEENTASKPGSGNPFSKKLSLVA